MDRGFIIYSFLLVSMNHFEAVVLVLNIYGVVALSQIRQTGRAGAQTWDPWVQGE